MRKVTNNNRRVAYGVYTVKALDLISEQHWKELREQKGTANPSTRLLTEIKSAIHRCVRPSTEAEWLLDTDEAIKVI